MIIYAIEQQTPDFYDSMYPIEYYTDKKIAENKIRELRDKNIDMNYQLTEIEVNETKSK